MKLQQLHDILAELANSGYDRSKLFFDHGAGVGNLCSWRGSYDCLSVEHRAANEATSTVSELLAETKDALSGRRFYGYKGGWFTMKPDTPIYADDWGECNYNVVIALEKNTKTDDWIVKTTNVKEFIFR